MAKKILLIEDETYISDLYRRQLEKEGFEVTGVKDGQEALDLLQKNAYDLVLLDIMLPSINGILILEKWSKNKSPNTKVILLTNLALENVLREGLNKGADGYLIKASYTPQQIVADIKAYVEGKPTQLIATSLSTE